MNNSKPTQDDTPTSPPGFSPSFGNATIGNNTLNETVPVETVNLNEGQQTPSPAVPSPAVEENNLTAENTVSDIKTQLPGKTEDDSFKSTAEASNNPFAPDPDIPTADNVVNPPATTVINSDSTDQTQSFGSDSKQLETIVMSPHAPKKYGGKKVIATIFGIIFLVGSVAAGISLVQRQQMLSQKAAGGAECSQAANCTLLEDPGNKGQYTAVSPIDYVDIKAGNAIHHFGQGRSSNECFLISVVDQTIEWEIVGQGAECKDISNIQVWVKQFDPEDTEWLIEQLCEGIELRVAGNHHSFEVFLDTSEDGNFWQEEQYWNLTDGEQETYVLKYNTIPEINSFVRIRIMQFDQIIKEWQGEMIDCSAISASPSPSDIDLVCNDIKIYDNQWNLMSQSSLSSLKAGDSVYLTVSGTASSGEIEKAMFIVNQTELPETTFTRSQTGEFYSEYVIPENTVTFDITAKLYHSEVGWF